jgi:hypothetical protein
MKIRKRIGAAWTLGLSVHSVTAEETQSEGLRSSYDLVAGTEDESRTPATDKAKAQLRRSGVDHAMALNWPPDR